MIVLGIETSCDDTGVAIYDTEKGLLANLTHTQTAHTAFGGIVPELASRDHVQKLLPLIQQALTIAKLKSSAISGIAYTRGPGLMGSLLVGAMLGRSLGMAWQVPTIGIHHLEGHLLAPGLEATPPAFPFIALLVSGGHTELVVVEKLGSYHLIGDTLDDAAGEAFDKTAKLLGLGYPGGAALAALAVKGTPGRFRFPRPMVNRQGLDFSFSGLKTFALQTITALAKDGPLDEQTKADIAFAFEEAVVETLVIKCQRALKAWQATVTRLVIAGGVSANRRLRSQLEAMCARQHAELFCPAPEFCMDNGAMIAYAGSLRLRNGETDNLAVEVLPRWPLTALNRAN